MVGDAIRPGRAVLLLALVLPQAACGAGWRRIEPERSANLPAHQQVQVWQAERMHRLHAVESRPTCSAECRSSNRQSATTAG